VSEPRFGVVTLQVEDGAIVGVQTPRGVKPLDRLLRSASPPTSVLGMLSAWEAWCEQIEQALDSDDGEAWEPEGTVTLLPPIPDPPTIYCAGANFDDHIREMGVENPAEGIRTPFHFLLPRTSLLGHRGVVRRPVGVVRLDWEVELAVVIGVPTRDVNVATALSHIAGYAVANDISIRDRDQIRHPWFGVRWLVSKGQTGFSPLGPALVPSRLVPDPTDLDLKLCVNDAVRQRASTHQMVFSVAQQVAYLSTIVALLPGDIILTGTPGGTGATSGYLEDGDRMTATIAGVGTLINEIAPAGSGAPSGPSQSLPGAR
jgi:2-keto-4-pentenoate hydratase/2-oxohepta-3-ene-1,7-dioic acid hydratase in catechol pathway